jgi:hypothetical protein
MPSSFVLASFKLSTYQPPVRLEFSLAAALLRGHFERASKKREDQGAALSPMECGAVKAGLPGSMTVLRQHRLELWKEDGPASPGDRQGQLAFLDKNQDGGAEFVPVNRLPEAS